MVDWTVAQRPGAYWQQGDAEDWLAPKANKAMILYTYPDLT